MQIIRLYIDDKDLGYFKEWSDAGHPVLTGYDTHAFQFHNAELAKRTAKWAVQMGHYHSKLSKDTKHELITITHGTI